MANSIGWKILLFVTAVAFLAPALLSFAALFTSGLWQVEMFAWPDVRGTFGFFASGQLPSKRGSAFFQTGGIGFVWPIAVALFLIAALKLRIRAVLSAHFTRDNMRFGGLFLVLFLCHRMLVHGFFPIFDSYLRTIGAVGQLPAHLVLSLPAAILLGIYYLPEAAGTVGTPQPRRSAARFAAQFVGGYLLYGSIGLTSMWAIFWFVWWIWLGPVEAVGNALLRVDSEEAAQLALTTFQYVGYFTPFAGVLASLISILLFFGIPSTLFGIAYWQAIRNAAPDTTTPPLAGSPAADLMH